MSNPNGWNPTAGRRAVWLLVSSALLLSACGSSSEEGTAAALRDQSTPAVEVQGQAEPDVEDAEPAAAAAATEAAVLEPTEVPAPTPTKVPASDASAFVKTSNLVYMTLGDNDFLLDVYTPLGEGPWPVVIAFHGLGTKNDDTNTKVAEAAAAQGMLVLAPAWLTTTTFPFTVDIFDVWKDSANCALAYAQTYATNNGGDPERSVVYGFSGGIGPALFASLTPRLGPIAGCAVDVSPTPVVGVVLGDGPYFVHDENFDAAFDDNLEGMRAEVAALVDPEQWPSDLDAAFFLWIPEKDTAPRRIFTPSDGRLGWFEKRDGDGSIRADLEALGLIEDEVVGNREAAFLLEHRLNAAGIDATLDQYPGGHTTLDKLPELVDYLLRAAGN